MDPHTHIPTMTLVVSNSAYADPLAWLITLVLMTAQGAGFSLMPSRIEPLG